MMMIESSKYVRLFDKASKEACSWWVSVSLRESHHIHNGVPYRFVIHLVRNVQKWDVAGLARALG